MKTNSSKPKTPLWSIFLVVGCTLIIAASQLMLKKSLETQGPILLQPMFAAAMASFIIGGMLLMFALKHGELSVLYPIISLGFVWIALESVFFLHEKISPTNIAGIAIIMVGVAIIGHNGTSRARDPKKHKQEKTNHSSKSRNAKVQR